jgi:hypothetical protein
MANATLNPTDLSSMTAPVPAAPVSVADTGIPADRLTQLLLKTLYTGEATGTQASERMCLPFSVIAPLLEGARTQLYIEVLGTTSASSGAAGYRYALTDLGRDRARQYLDANQYVGPAPVPLEAYVAQIMGVRAARGYIDRDRLRAGFSHLIVADELLEQLGPAVNAGKGLFLYGPPGNGKSVIAEGLGRSLGGDLYVPYAIDIDGQIVTVFDPVNHETLEPAAQEQGSIVRTAPRDRRWVRIRRPVVIVGGELTLDMLDLSFNPIAKFHEAPLQMKANGGVFMVDDFGRQRMRPEDLLNRWIVPLESRVDYLTLHTGRKFHVPFEVLIVFATNLDPLSLADEAFLRRIPYKIPIGDPTMAQFTEIFELNCRRKGLRFHQVMVAYLIRRHYAPINRPLRACQPRDVIDQVIALSRYRGHEPVITREMIDAACRAYFVDGDLESGGIARTKGSGVKRSSGSLEVH